MRLMGRDTGELRLPMTPLSADQEAKLRQTLADYGLLGAGGQVLPHERPEPAGARR
jgi:hypothetical protein